LWLGEYHDVDFPVSTPASAPFAVSPDSELTDLASFIESVLTSICSCKRLSIEAEIVHRYKRGEGVNQ
jgi:hypothetical protein